MNKSKGYKKIDTKNGLNIYEAVIEVGYDINGKRKRIKRRHTGNNASAEIWYAELVKEYYHKSNKINLTDMSFRDYSNIFIEKYCIPNVSKITIKGYRQYLKCILPLIGDYKLTNITSFILDNMYQKIKKGQKGKLLSSKTMVHYYNLVNLMFKQARKWKFIEINPNEDANRPKLHKKNRNYYNIEQAQDLLNVLSQENIKYRTIITLALVSGMRCAELCALRWSDVDFIKNTIYIDNSLKVIDGEIDEERAKTDYSVRYVYIDIKTMELLKEYKKWQEEHILSLGDKWIGTDRIFTDIYGKNIYPCTCNKILQKVIKKYNLPHITFHELRHTCATILNGTGVDPIVVKERLGHSNVNITMDTYTHALESNKKASVDVFDKLQSNVNNNITTTMAQNYGTTQ